MRIRTRDEWMQLIAEYKTSGLQQKEFVAKHDLSFETFKYWLYRASKKATLASNSSPKFLPVEVVASPAPQARVGVLEAALPGGVVLRFVAGTDTRYLAELFAALR